MDQHADALSPRDDETPAETLTRNWNELLQELRVTQTGSQILTGFLLTVPFSNRFSELTSTQRGVYLAVLSGAIVSTALMLAPVAFHRILFRHGKRAWLVRTANQMARIGLGFVALTTTGVAFLVFDLVAGRAAAVVAAGVALVVFVALWVVVPLRLRD